MILLTPPAAEPVTVADAKAALRIDDTRYDAILPGLISAARMVAEQETGQRFVAQTWRTELSDWPAADDVIAVYRATAAAVSYWDGAAWQTLSGAAYVYGPDADTGAGTVIVPAIGSSWPTLGEIATGPRVRIDLTTGVAAGDAGTIADCVQTYITALVGQLIASPELSAQAASASHPLLARLLDSQRLYT